jgi:hypothetical protein
MGFSHSWYRPQVLAPELFRAAVEDFRKMLPIFKRMGIALVDPQSRKAKPALTPHLVHFNGKPGVEDFFIEAMFTDRMTPSGKCFAFCKTREQPYDFAVMCALLIFEHHLRETIKICSDGDLSHWIPAINAVQEHLGYKEDWAWIVEESKGLTDKFLISVQEKPCLKSENPTATDGAASS